MVANRQRSLLTAVSVAVIPVLLATFAVIYKLNRPLYMRLTVEDGIVEWATAACLLAAGIVAAVLALRYRRRSRLHVWFFVIFSAASLAFTLEEISWGQRIFGIKSPEFFVENSDQQEINVHNVLQKRFHFKTKHVAGRLLFYYGAVLPILLLDPRIRKFLSKVRFMVPPVSLSLAFFIATLLMWDKPTGREEELGELFFSICFVLFMLSSLAADSAKEQN